MLTSVSTLRGHSKQAPHDPQAQETWRQFFRGQPRGGRLMRQAEMAPEVADGEDSLLTVVFFDRISPSVSLSRFQTDIIDMAMANNWALMRLNGRAVDINALA